MDNQSVELEILREKLKQYQQEQQSMLPEYINAMRDNQTCEVPSNYDIWRKRGIGGFFEKAFKKVIRKIIAWCLVPICERQTSYNLSGVKALEEADMRFSTLQQSMTENDRKAEDAARLHAERLLDAFKEKYREEQEAYKNQLHYAQSEVVRLREEMDIIKRTEIIAFEEQQQANFWDKRSRAQAGEDSIMLYIFRVMGIDLSKEYYLDLGANHAKDLSNTYLLYENGMRGVLVEANPKLIGELKLYRGDDIIINKCITTDESVDVIHFYVLNGDGLSCMDRDTVDEVIAKNPDLKVEEEIDVPTITVSKILEKHFDKGPLVLNVDLEGMELDILKEIDYSKYAPFLIIVERIPYDTNLSIEKSNDGIEEFLTEKGYFEYAFTGINSIYMNRKMLGR